MKVDPKFSSVHTPLISSILGPSPKMPHQHLVILFPIWACMALVTMVLTQASLGPGYSIPHLGLTLTSDLWSHSGPQTKLVTLVPPLGLTITW